MQPISVLDLFKIGIGPSSSHTVGPMKAAFQYLDYLQQKDLFDEVSFLKVELFGSLAMTGKGHATDIAIFLGLEGELPCKVDPDSVPSRIEAIKRQKELNLKGVKKIFFDPSADLLFHRGKRLSYHSNAMKIKAFDAKKVLLASKIYYSIGGGFILDHEEIIREKSDHPPLFPKIPYPFKTASELMDHAQREGKAIWEIVWKNELCLRPSEEVLAGIYKIWETMESSVEKGLKAEGELPGGLGLKRRALKLFEFLQEAEKQESKDEGLVFDWVSLYALAVNEENAAGGRIVTAPTNGSAGVIPSVLHYAKKYTSEFNDEKLFIFFLTATAIGTLYKLGASISAAEMGCQGEIGVSSSMAAAGLAAILGGTNEQIENAAEIAMEHHLGLTCDPIAGLVQAPCIERNTMGAIKAINAARLALRGDGTHVVSLDAVIRAMKETGENMKSMYKETSEGGLSLQVSVMEPIC